MRDTVSTLISERLDELGKNQAWLGVVVAEAEGLDAPYSQPTASKWISQPDVLRPSRMFIIEEVLQLPPGKLSRHFGYIPAAAKPVKSVPDAIDADSRLDESGRRMLHVMYHEYVKR